MGLRFHKSLKLIPGIRLNFSKSGPSVSLGQRGATYNIGTKGQRATVGLPGSGLSYSERSSKKKAIPIWLIVAIIAILIGKAILS